MKYNSGRLNNEAFGCMTRRGALWRGFSIAEKKREIFCAGETYRGHPVGLLSLGGPAVLAVVTTRRGSHVDVVRLKRMVWSDGVKMDAKVKEKPQRPVTTPTVPIGARRLVKKPCLFLYGTQGGDQWHYTLLSGTPSPW